MTRRNKEWLSSLSYWPWRTRIQSEGANGRKVLHSALRNTAASCQGGWEASSWTVCWALAALCCRLGTSPNLSRLSNQPLGCTGAVNSRTSPLGMCLTCQHGQLELCLESQQGPTLNWECKCAPFWLPKWAAVIFHNPSEYRHSDMEKHLQHKNLTDTHGETGIFSVKINI